MKFFAFLLYWFIIGSPPRSEELTADLIEFLDLNNIDDITVLSDRYMQEEEFRTAMDYILNGEGIRELMVKGEQIPEYITLLNYVEDSGADAYAFINNIHEIWGLEPLIPPKPSGIARSPARRNILNEFRDDIRRIAPQAEIAALHESKQVTSPAFKLFSDRIKAPEFADIVQDLRDNAAYKEIKAELLINGVDLENAALFYSQLFGFSKF